MPVVNPGIRRFLGSAIQRLFNGASFSAPLTHSAIPTRAASGTTATFTRATTATVRDNEGVLRTAIAGEARFEGARRVRNLLTLTEDFSTAVWSKSNASMSANQIAAPNGTTTADLFTATANAQQTVWFAAGITGVYSTVYSAYVKAGTATWLNFTLWDGAGVLGGGIQVWFNLSTGAVGSSVVGAGFSLTGTSTESVGAGWYRIAIAGTATGGTFVPAFRITDSNGVNATTATNGKTFYIWGAQLEDITGRADQTTPSEYVSVGVESAPLYHGSGVDGVKCFATDINGAAIPSSTLLGYQAEGARTNLCLQSNAFTTTWINAAIVPVQNVVGPDGATSAWTLEDNSAIAFESIGMSGITLTAAAYTLSIYIKKTSGSTKFPVLQVYSPTGLGYSFCTCDTNNGVATIWTSNAYGTTLASGSARCSSFNADFWRFEMTFTGTALTDYVIVLYPTATANATQASGSLDATLTGTNVFYGCMLELGYFASSYIPTTTIAVARNADVLTYSSAGNVSGTVGWCYAEFSTYAANAAQYSGIVGTIDAGGGSPLMLNVGALKPMIYDGTTLTVVTGNSVTANVLSKAVSTWGGSTMSVCLAGSTVVSGAFDGEIGYTTTNGIGIGTRTTAGANILNGNIKNVRIGQRQLSASELQAVTA